MRNCKLLRGNPFKFFESGSFFSITHGRRDDRRLANGYFYLTEYQNRLVDRKQDWMQSSEVRQVVAPPHQARVVPTHFLSLRVRTNGPFRQQMEALYADIKEEKEHESKLLIPLDKLHLTLSVLTVDNEKQKEQLGAIENAMQLCAANFFKKSLNLHMFGLGTFNGRVLFVKLHADKDFIHLDRLVRQLRLRLGNMGIDIKGNHNDSFVPHITLAKIRPSQAKEFGRTVPREMYSRFLFDDFGNDFFTGIELCEMNTDEKTGYYKVVKQVEFGRPHPILGTQVKNSNMFTQRLDSRRELLKEHQNYVREHLESQKLETTPS